MLTEQQFNDYIKELYSRHRAAQMQLEQAKATLNAIEGMIQAANEIKELSTTQNPDTEAKEVTE